MKIAVLGTGMVGSAIALDLASRHHVTAFDVSNNNLELLKKRNPRIETQQADLRDYATYPQFLSSFDIVVTAVPGFMGYKTLEAVINCGKNIVDISFFPEDVLQLDKLAKEKGFKNKMRVKTNFRNFTPKDKINFIHNTGNPYRND